MKTYSVGEELFHADEQMDTHAHTHTHTHIHTDIHTNRQTYRHDVVNSSFLQFCNKHLKNGNILSEGETWNSEPSVHKGALTPKTQNPTKCLRLGRNMISSIFPFAKKFNERFIVDARRSVSDS
jgi:hypothetical protein